MINKKKISFFSLPKLLDLPTDLKDRILKIQEKTGFVPNVFIVLGHRPNELRCFMNYYDYLMKNNSKLKNFEKEMIIVATSMKNNCLYCVISHGAILRVQKKDSCISDMLAVDYKKANITNKQKLMLDFSVKLARNPELISEKDHALLIKNGFDKEQIWDIGSITSFFSLSNRMAILTSMQPNQEFFSMGR